MDGSTAPAQAEPDDDARYLKAIASCGDKRSLVVSQPIYSTDGVKLLDTGARMDSRVLERLFGHKLAVPIDRCVTTDAVVGHEDLATRARALVSVVPLLAHFDASLGLHSNQLWSALGGCPLPPAIAIRLTVARDTAAALYEHLLRSAFLALFIGSCAEFSQRELQLLATAALLHDIGMMHADPTLYQTEKPRDIVGRRHLLAHPLSGELVAQREPQLSPIIAAAIAQHHERLDGTGYPRGLEGEAISKFGRVLMLVEVALALLEDDQEQPDRQLSMILRLNDRTFDPKLCELLLGALHRSPLGEGETAGQCLEFQQVNSLIDASPQACGATPPPADDPAPSHESTQQQASEYSEAAPRTAAPVACKPAVRLGQILEDLREVLFDPTGTDRLAHRVETIAADLTSFAAKDADRALFLGQRHLAGQHAVYSVLHATRCAIACDLISRRLAWPDEDAASLLKAALTMNIAITELQGTLALRPPGQNKPSAEEADAITAHPTRGAAILATAGVDDPDWLQAVEQHHERLDGTGYPTGTCKPSRLACVLRYVDEFFAKTSARASRAALQPQQAARQLYGDADGSPIVEALIKELGLYPPGTFVRLANGDLAIVRRRGEHINTPRAIALANHKGERLPRQVRRDTSDVRYRVIMASNHSQPQTDETAGFSEPISLVAVLREPSRNNSNESLARFAS